ncbi:MAG: FAD-dependent oxidoreductase [bacterium]
MNKNIIFLDYKKDDSLLPSEVDAVVVGSGLGGLASALELSRHGFSVCVLEKHSQIGGYAHSFRRKNYRFDASLHHIGALGKGTPVHDVLDCLGVLSKLEIAPKKTVFSAEFPDFSISVPNKDGALENELIKMFPEEKKGITKLLSFLKKLKTHIMGPWIDPDFNVSEEKLINRRYVDKTFSELVSEFISDKKLKAVFAQFWTLIGLPPELATANFSTCVFNSHFLEGSYDIKGGGAAFSETMAERISELGGICFVNAEVSDISVSSGNVRGVELRDGKRIESKLVISNADPYHTFFELLPESATKNIFKFRLKKMKPSVSFYSLYAGLDCFPSEIGIPDNTFFYNHGFSPVKAYERSMKNELHHTDWAVTNYENSGMASAPENCGVVSFVEVTPGDGWFDISEKEYSDRKKETKTRLLEKYDRKFPGLKKHIEVMEFATPRTMNRYTGNYKGSIYGLAQTVEQSNSKRLRNVTPVKNLYLTGAWTWAGGGYEGALMSGIQTAAFVFEDFPTNISRSDIRYRRCDCSETSSNITTFISEEKRENLLKKGYVLKKITTYPGDIREDGRADTETLLRFMDRGRVDTGEQIFHIEGDDSLLKNFTLQVYALQIKIHRLPVSGEQLSVFTKYMKKASFRAVCHQTVCSENGEMISEAMVELVNLDKKGELTSIPEQITEENDVTPVYDPGKKIFTPLEKRFYRIVEKNLRVYTENTDLQGVTFHASYVHFSDAVLFDFLKDKNSEVKVFWKHKNFYIRYLHSTTMGQHIKMKMAVGKNKKGKIVVEQKILSEDTGTVVADICFEPEFRDKNYKICSVPEKLKKLAGA